MDAISVAVVRHGVVEAVHTVHAAAVQDRTLVAAAGDPGLVTYFRSSAKPLQALPVARARDDLECGPEPTRIEHNCSGKHAGMLALCRAQGWPLEGYRLAGHPVQRGCLAEVAAAAEVDPESIPTSVDGCGVVTFALPLERMARAFSRLESLDAGARVAAAMRAHPDLVRGPLSPDTRLMEALTGWTAKVGAEGIVCAAGPDGLGVALKCADGAGRPLEQALRSFLATVGVDFPQTAPEVVRNSRGEAVGEVVVL